MNPTIPARVQARAHADRRLQSMTLSAAVLGLAATGVFGYAAALTYAGTSSNPANPQSGAGANPQTQSGFGGDDQQFGGENGENGESQQQAQPNQFFGQVNPPTTTRHHSSTTHVSSGGS